MIVKNGITNAGSVSAIKSIGDATISIDQAGHYLHEALALGAAE
jgi:hypothetical protein